MKKYLLFLSMLCAYSSVSNAYANFINSNQYNTSSKFQNRDGNSLSKKKIPISLSKHFADGIQNKDDYLQRGEIYLYNKDYNLAIKDFEQVLEEDKYNLNALVGLTESYIAINNIYKADEYISLIFNDMMPVYFSGPFYKSLWARAYESRAKLKGIKGDTEGAQSDREKSESLK